MRMYGSIYSIDKVFDVWLYGSVSSNIIFMPNYCYSYFIKLYAYYKISIGLCLWWSILHGKLYSTIMSIMIGLILGIGCCGINHTLCHTGYMVLVSII